MTMHQKAVAAGFAILVAGAVVGWNASRMADARSEPALVAGRVDEKPAGSVEEKPQGDLTPRQTYSPAPTKRATPRVARRAGSSRGITIPAGTPMVVTVNEALSSKTAAAGESWHGVVAEPVYRNGRVVIPAGSPVSGVVAVSRPAERGDRATLQLALRSVSIAGRSYSVRGTAPAVRAGSPRARNLGAIAGGTAAGALIGRAVGGSTKSTVVGAVVGGGAATAAVAASKGYQATIPAGKDMSFTTGSSMTVRA